MRFWDSSAVVPLLLEEERSAEIEDLARSDGGLLLWWGTPVECASAIRREERRATVTRETAIAALEALDLLVGESLEIVPSARLRSRAQRLLAVHDLRAADACQLAAAVAWTEGEPGGAPFVCLDGRLGDAASREGFRVLPS